MSDNTASRERAEKWVTWYLNDERNVEEPDEQLVLAYIVGAREEAAIHKKKIQNLRDLVKSQEQDIDRIYAEIAALREEVAKRYTVEEVSSWLAEYHGRYREIPMTEWIAVRRALEEKP